MSDIPKLHYIDVKNDTLREIEYNRSRAMSVSPIFYTDRVAGLVALKDRCEERANHYVCKISEIEREIAKEKQRINKEIK